MTTREQLLAEIEQTPDFLLDEVLDFLLFTRTRRVNLTDQPIATQPSSLNQKPIWEDFEEFAEQIPDEIVQSLPVDGAAQIDHYLYGSPKQDT